MFGRYLSCHRDILIVGGLLALRITVFALRPGIINGDGFLYIDAAQHILKIGYLPDASFQARSYSVVIAPIIAMLGHHAEWTSLAAGTPLYNHPVGIAVHIAQILIDLAVVAALLHLCFHLLRGRKTALRIAYCVVALQPITAAWVSFVYPDTIATAALFVGLFYLARGSSAGSRPNMLIGGLVLGVAAVMRIDVAVLVGALLIGWLAFVAWRAPRDRGWAGTMVAVLALSVSPPLAMAGYQYVSSGDPRYIRSDGADNPWNAKRGYFAWTRTWVTSRQEYAAFILSIADPAKLDADAFPDRALPQRGDREILRSALRRWSDFGYDASVDASFAGLASAQSKMRPFLAYVTAPALRAGSMWVSPEGSRELPFTDGDSLYSRAARAAVLLLKAAIALLAAIGAIVLLDRIVRARREMSFVLEYPTSLLCLSFAAFFLRFLEMWVLNVVGGGSIVEPRYATETWPGIIAIALYGYRAVIDTATRRGARLYHASKPMTR